mmetsp:Transcript_39147/g.92102  ORF Transcript_39147/g.92102 Transcript_39147/m.92102 type:complete len:919 (+) Transcript_39147:117-2873(+)
MEESSAAAAGNAHALKVPRELPACSLCLVVAVLVCHCIVLAGNLATARSLEIIGASVTGWSDVGLALGSSLNSELDPGMANVTTQLTSAAQQILTVQEEMDSVLMIIGQSTDDASSSLLDEVAGTALAGPEKSVRDAVRAKVKQHTQKLEEAVEELLRILRPALQKVGEWLVSFGDQLQGSVEAFSVTIDKVQKLFDNLMVHFAPVAGDSEELEYDTFNLFDVDGDGIITIFDLRNVSAFYGIEALQGEKSTELVHAHDSNGNGVIDEEEFHDLVTDDSIYGAMAIVLRQYAKLLSSISGNVAAARMRDEVAHAVVDYFSLVVAKNMTKVGWVADRLTNGSLPLEFTADILKGLAVDEKNPNKKTLQDVGFVVVSEMMKLNSDYTLRALKLMSDPSFWESEGFDPDDQVVCVEKVTDWAQKAASSPSLLQLELQSIFGGAPPGGQGPHAHRGSWAAIARMNLSQSVRRHHAKKVEAAAQHLLNYTSSETSVVLLQALLGGRCAQPAVSSPETTMTVNSGVPAVPKTLEFAAFLASNASSTADRLQLQTFNASGTSSNPLQSFANQVKSLSNKFASVLKLLQRFASPTGFEELVKDLKSFGDKAADEIVPVVEKKLQESSLFASASMVQRLDAESRQRATQEPVAGIWLQASSILTSLAVALPPVISNLKLARREVSSVAMTLESTFGMLKDQGEPAFLDFAVLYRSLWITYFVALSLMTLLLLVYAFWAGGYFSCDRRSSATPVEGELDYVPPSTFRERCAACCRSCCACCRSCQDTAMCFWSAIIFAELVALVLFVIAIVLCVLAGVKTFVASGCAQVYMLSDTAICSGMFLRLQDWLSSFTVNGNGPEVVCSTETLTTCEVLAKKMRMSAILTICGSLPAAILTFQMIVEAGVLHERARWRKIVEERLDDSSAPAQ